MNFSFVSGIYEGFRSWKDIVKQQDVCEIIFWSISVKRPSVPVIIVENCHREYHETDMTREAKWVVNCVAETRGRYGLTIVLGTLLGAKRARLRELGADKYKSYGALNDHSEAELRALISQMTEMGYLYQTQERYSVLKLGDISPLRDENTHVIMRTYEEKDRIKRKAPEICQKTQYRCAYGSRLRFI